MKCDVCKTEIEGGTKYRVLALSYVTETAPRKKNPYRRNYVGMVTGTFDVCFSEGYNTYVDEAKICDGCQGHFDEILEQMRMIFAV